MTKCLMDINAITACNANKPFLKVLTPFTTIGISAQSNFTKCYKPKREGTSLRGISRITGLAYNTIVRIVRSSSVKPQLIYNDQALQVETKEVIGDEL